MEQIDKDIKRLIKSRNDIYRKEYNREISNEECEKQIIEIDKELRALSEKKIYKMQQRMVYDKETFKINERVKSELKEEGLDVEKLQIPIVQKKINDIKKTDNKLNEKIEKRNNVQKTKTEIFIEVLLDEHIDSFEKSIIEIKKQFPEMKTQIIEHYLRNFVSKLKSGKIQKYKNYEFDNKNFTIREIKQQTIRGLE